MRGKGKRQGRNLQALIRIDYKLLKENERRLVRVHIQSHMQYYNKVNFTFANICLRARAHSGRTNTSFAVER